MNEGHFSLDENAARMAAYIFKTYKPGFLALHFAEVDGEEHEQGRDGDSVRLAVEVDDRAIGDVLEAIQVSGLKDSTTIIIVGDHGFCTINTVFRPNLLLVGIAAKFLTAGGSAFLYPTGAPPLSTKDCQHLIQQVRQRLDSLPREQRERFRFVDRSELDQLGADSAAIFALAAQPGLVFSGAVATSPSALFAPVTGGHHGYDPHIPDMWTGFIAEGAEINAGKMIRELCVTDIAPLVAQLLGVPFTCPDGKLVPGILIN